MTLAQQQAVRVPATQNPIQVPIRAAVAAIERLVADAISRAEELHARQLLPDLEKCSLAAARAGDSLNLHVDSDSERAQHDLRNHLGAVSGYVELLLEDHGENLQPVIAQALEQLRERVTQVLSGDTGVRPAASGSSSALPGAAEPGTLLVIDDSEHSRELLGRYLVRQQHRVLSAASGAEAMEILATSTVDLVFLDLVMPEMSGLEVLQRIKADPRLRAVPVIIVSGISESAGVIQCIEAGAEDYLNKPFNPVLLQARLNAGLQRKRWHDREEAYRRELERNQRFIRNTFGRYLSDEIVDALLESPQGLNLGGTTCRVTILMADIRNFSQLCESHAPEQVVQLLNNYLGAMSEIIMSNHGTVDEFIGDAILAIFGAPVSREDDAQRSIVCAIQMQEAVADINRRNAELGLPEIAIGIGLNTGEVVAGNIGSERRSKYGVVGHTVNLTARIESYTAGGEILASASTIAEVGAAVETGRRFTALPKGMAAEVTVFSITGVRAEAPAAQGLGT